VRSAHYIAIRRDDCCGRGVKNFRFKKSWFFVDGFWIFFAGFCRLLTGVCMKSNNLKTARNIIIYRVNYTSSVSVLTTYFRPFVLPKYSLLISICKSVNLLFPRRFLSLEWMKLLLVLNYRSVEVHADAILKTRKAIGDRPHEWKFVTYTQCCCLFLRHR